MAESQWGFTSADDARTYLREVGALWAVWVLGLTVLFLNSGWVIIGAGALVIALLIWLARPLHSRVVRIVPQDDVIGNRRSLVVGRGTKRDRALRAFAYGSGPLGEAVELAGSGRWWLYARQAVVGATIAAFLWTLFTFVQPPAA